MAIKTSCPHCEASYNLPDTVAGKKVRCKKCQEAFLVSANGANGTNGTNGHAAADTVPVVCPHCETPARVRAKPGERVRCKRCGEGFTISRQGTALSGKTVAKPAARKTALADDSLGDDDDDDTKNVLQAKARPGKAPARDEDDDEDGDADARDGNGRTKARAAGKAPPRDEDDEDETAGRNGAGNGTGKNRGRVTARAAGEDDDDDDDEPVKPKNKKTVKGKDEEPDKGANGKGATGIKTKLGKAAPLTTVKKDDDDEDEEDKPAKKKKKSKKKPFPMLIVGGGGGGLLGLIALLFVLLSGGGGDDDGKKKKKKGEAPPVVSDNKGKIEGTAWTSLPVIIKDKNTNQDKLLEAGSLKLEFNKDGSLVAVVLGSEKPKGVKGKYTLGDKDKVTLEYEEETPEGKKETKLELKIAIQEKENRLNAEDPESQKVVYERFEREEDLDTGPIDLNDPFQKRYKELKESDPVRHADKIKSAAEWFLANFKDFQGTEKWRRKIAMALELPIDHNNFRLVDVCWESFTTWVTKKEIPRLRLQLARAPKTEYKQMIMRDLAEFETKDSLEVLATTMDEQGTEQELAQKLLAGIHDTELALKVVFPYVYHHDRDVRNIAYSLCEIYNVDISTIPRLPPLPPKETMALDLIPGELASAKEWAGKSLLYLKYNWTSPERMKHLAVLDWLQSKTLSKNHWVDISKALDPLILSYDQFMREQAQMALRVWAHPGNVETLVAAFKEERLLYEQPEAIDLLKRIADPTARIAIIELLPNMRVIIREKLYEDSKPGADDAYLMSLPKDDGSREALLKHFNHEYGDIRAITRKAITTKYLPEREFVFAQCVKDLADEKKGIHAISWLASQEPLIVEDPSHLDPIMDPVKAMAENDDPKKGAEKREALKALALWADKANAGPPYWIRVLDQEKYHLNDWRRCRMYAMGNIGNAKWFEGIPALVYRYKDEHDREHALGNLQRLNKVTPNGPILFDKKLCETFEKANKKQRLEVCEIMKLEAGFGCYKLLDETLDSLKDRPQDRDLASAITAAMAAIEGRPANRDLVKMYKEEKEKNKKN